MEKVIIIEKKVWINHRGVIPNHVIEQDGAKTHSAKQDTRFCIATDSGIIQDPACIPRNVTADNPEATRYVHTTRRYKHEVDKTYFRFFDDAEEILNNIIALIEWLEKTKTMDMNRKRKKLAEKHYHLTELRDIREEILALRIESSSKTRENLDSLHRDLADERDLIGAEL